MSNKKARAQGAFYSLDEDKKILDYIITKDLYSCVKGRAIWERMAIDISVKGKGKGRSWHSLKERYTKYIIPNLKDYDLGPKVMDRLQEPFKWAGESSKTSKRAEEKKSVKIGPRNEYDESDDEKIIHHVRKTKGDFKGNRLWKQLESKEILKGRTWQSLKGRFLNHIFENLDSLTDAETAKLLKKRMKDRRNAETNEDSSAEEPEQGSKQKTLYKRKRALFRLERPLVFNSPLLRDTPQRLKARRAHHPSTLETESSFALSDFSPDTVMSSTRISQQDTYTEDPSSSISSSDTPTSGSEHSVAAAAAAAHGEETRLSVRSGSSTKVPSTQTSTVSTFFEAPVKASTECCCDNWESPTDVVPCSNKCKILLGDMKTNESNELIESNETNCSDFETVETKASVGEEEDNTKFFIDPLFAYFVENNIPRPHIVLIRGEEVCLDSLDFPVLHPSFF